MVDKVIGSGANVVLCQKGLDDMAQHYLAKAGIIAVRRIKESDLTKLAKATAKREGKTIAADGTISGNTDATAVSYRERNTITHSQLPTRYDTDNSLIDNANTGGLVTGRPWTA